jgi:hypothetical protein
MKMANSEGPIVNDMGRDYCRQSKCLRHLENDDLLFDVFEIDGYHIHS